MDFVWLAGCFRLLGYLDIVRLCILKGWLLSVAMLLEWLDVGRLTCWVAVVRDCFGITRMAGCCKAD